MKPSCDSGRGSRQNPGWREWTMLGRRRYEVRDVGLGTWDLTSASRALLWPGLLTCPFCWGLNPEASLSEVALSPGLNFSLKVAPLKVHRASTSDVWPWKGRGELIQVITFSGSTVTTGSAN